MGGSPDGSAGNYGGVLQPASPSDPISNSGLIQLQLSNAGAMSGVVIWQGKRYPFKGKLADGSSFQKIFPKKLSSEPVDLSLFLTLSTPSRFIFGTLSENVSGSPETSVPVSLNGAPADPVLIEKLRPGLRISFIEPPDATNEGEDSFPVATGISELGAPAVTEITGDGFVHVRISKSKKRAARMIGRLPDASGVFTAGSPLRGSSYAVFSSLYKKNRRQGGQLFGNAGVSEDGDSADLTSSFRWGKDAEPDSKYYPNPFNLSFNLDAVQYPKLKPHALVPLLPQTSTTLALAAPYGAFPEPTRSINARILFRRGNIDVGGERFFKQNIKITPFHTRVVGDNPYRVKIQVDAFSGRFRGTFMHPVLNAKTKFRGAFQASILFTPGQGRGHFRPPSGPRIAPLAEPLESGGVRINVN